MNIVILGAQGSGKGTQARLLSDKLGLFHMETGKMLREMGEGDERIRDIIDKGALVPDKETINYMQDYILRNGASFDKLIFDGFPRTVEQYTLLKQWLAKHNSKIDYVIYLEVSEETSVKRLSARRICEKCGRVYNLITDPPPSGRRCECGGELVQREDDKPETIKRRLEIFKAETLPVVEKVEQEGRLLRVNGEEPPETIFKVILERLERQK